MIRNWDPNQSAIELKSQVLHSYRRGQLQDDLDISDDQLFNEESEKDEDDDHDEEEEDSDLEQYGDDDDEVRSSEEDGRDSQ